MRVALAIIGSGFASYEVARAVAAANRSVAVLERGTADPSPHNLTLSPVPYRREPVVSGGVAFGARVPEGFENVPRYVGLGGTSALWSGKWRRLDTLDLTREVAGRRWPIDAEELRPHLAALEDENGRPDWNADAAFAEHRARAAREGIRLVEMYEQAEPLRLRPLWDQLAAGGLVRVECGVETIGAAFGDGERVTELHLRDAGGERVIAADHVVIACGGIESVRVSHDLRTWVRRQRTQPLAAAAYGGFMDHPKAALGEVVVERNLSLAEYLQQVRPRGRAIGFALPEEDLRRDRMGNHIVFPWSDDPVAIGQPLELTINLEQFPEPTNFVTATPPASVSWRLSSATLADAERFIATLAPRLTTLLGPVSLNASLRFRGASHHMGALPMGETEDSPVDARCRLRGFDNVSCVSSAIFPVAGSANPTLTVAALARRLAADLVS